MNSPSNNDLLSPEAAAFLDDLHRHLRSCSSLKEVEELLRGRLPGFLQQIQAAKAPGNGPKVLVNAEAPAVHEKRPIIGDSQGLKTVMELVAAVAPGDTTVLITGETGTGKELIARAIHDDSPRRGGPMVCLNCAAIPPGLIESELFGHEEGSFTGATVRRAGSFERANGGTLLLDEIGEMTLSAQAKLLRVIQEKEIDVLGGRHPVATDVRLICATSRDLASAVREGKFRADLYYRLYVFPITVPPLRERKEDLLPLANYFLQSFCKKTGKSLSRLSTAAMRQLLAHEWPGNVRELEHVIERGVLLATGVILKEVILPGRAAAGDPGRQSDFITLAEYERAYIVRVLRACHGKIRGSDGAARLLDMPPTTLHSKIKKLGIAKHAE